MIAPHVGDACDNGKHGWNEIHGRRITNGGFTRPAILQRVLEIEGHRHGIRKDNGLHQQRVAGGMIEVASCRGVGPADLGRLVVDGDGIALAIGDRGGRDVIGGDGVRAAGSGL